MSDVIERNRLAQLSTDRFRAASLVMESAKTSGTQTFAAHWLVGLNLFRQMEVDFILQKERNASSQQNHRSFLSMLLGMGEQLLTLDAGAVALFGLPKNVIEANVRYLRDKYIQWYVYVGEEEVQRAVELIDASTPITNQNLPVETPA